MESRGITFESDAEDDERQDTKEHLPGGDHGRGKLEGATFQQYIRECGAACTEHDAQPAPEREHATAAE